MIQSTSQASQIRALRLRLPTPCTVDWLESQIAAAAQAGFNTLVIDAFARGFTCFPFSAASEYGLRRIHPSFRKTDMLERTSVFAHDAELRLVAALDCMNLGPKEQYPRSPFAERRFRSWRISGPPETFKKHPPCDGPDLLLCPANPELRDLASTLAAEITDVYPIDGIMLPRLQFGPAEGQNVGRCFCEICTSRERISDDSADNGVSWDAYRLKQISQYVSCVKARARQSRRNLRIWGEPPQLPGCSCSLELLSNDFDHELMDVCVVPLNREDILLCTPPAAGVEISTFPADCEEAINEADRKAERAPLGFVAQWTSSDVIRPSHVKLPNLPGSQSADADPVAAARQWLEIAAREMNGPAGNHARRCIAILEENVDDVDGPPLDSLHAAMAAALPEDNSRPDDQLALVERAFALIRLAIMVRV